MPSMKLRHLSAITTVTVIACLAILTAHQPNSDAYAAPTVTSPCRQPPCAVRQPRKPIPVRPTTTTTPPTTTAPPTFSACVPLGAETPNGWRAGLGRPALTYSTTIEAGACAWSLQMATTGVFAHAGVGGEVIALVPGYAGASGAWAQWEASPAHYSLLTASSKTKIGCGAVKKTKANGSTSWYVTCRVTA